MSDIINGGTGQTPAPAATPVSRRPEWFVTMTSSIVKSIAMIVVSLVLIALLLCPFVRVRYANLSGKSYDVTFSPVELSVMAVRSFFGYDDVGIVRTDAYAESTKLAKRALSILSSSGRLSPEQENVLSDYVKSQLSLDLMRLGGTPKASLIFALLATLTYVILLLTMLGYAAAALLKKLLGKKENETVAAAGKIAVFLTTASPIYILLCFHASRMAVGALGASIGFGGFLTALVYLLILGYVGLVCYDRLTAFKRIKLSYKRKTKLVAIALAAVMALAVFLPVVSVRYAAKRSGSVAYRTQYVGSSDIHETSYEEMEYYTSLGMLSSGLDSVAKGVIEGKDGYDEMETVTLHASVEGVYSDCRALYLFVAVFAFATLGMALFLLSKLTRSLLGGDEVTGGTVAFAIIMASVYLILSIVLVAMANSALWYSVSSYVMFGVAIGPILSLIASVMIAVAISLEARPRVKGGYDNPDTSYAPYVV